MLKQQSRIITFFVFLFDLALTLLAFHLAYHLRDRTFLQLFPSRFASGLYPLVLYNKLLPPILLIWAFFLWYFRLYASHRTHSLIREMGEVLRIVAASTVVLLTFIFIAKYTFISRPWLALFAGLDALFLLVEKLLLRLVARWVRRRGFNYRNLVIIGDGPKASELAGLIRSNPHWGYRLLGFIADGDEILGTPNLGKLQDLPAILEREVVDDIIFVMNRRKIEDLTDALFTCQEVGIKTRLALHTIPRLGGSIHLEEIDHTPLLTLSRTPTNLPALIVKKLMDLIFGILFFIIFLPVMAAAALLILIGSGRPILYRQKRVGLNGRLFTLYKFRTMVPDAERQKDELQEINEMDGPVFKAKHDPRIIRFGSLLRRLSLDELPQFWNVVKGDMSLVGPRPLMPDEVAKVEKWQRRRLSMKPGLTCHWQVSGRNKVDFATWMEMDLAYIDNWSLGLDLKIILKTIPAVLLGRGAR